MRLSLGPRRRQSGALSGGEFSQTSERIAARSQGATLAQLGPARPGAAARARAIWEVFVVGAANCAIDFPIVARACGAGPACARGAEGV